MSDNSAKAQAEQLLNKLLKGKEVHDMFNENMRRQLKISGQPIEHWEKHFTLKIPTDNLTPSLCQELDLKLMALNQEATFLNAIATAKSQLIKRGSEAAFLGTFAALVQEYKSKGGKLPAASTIETLARIDTEDLESAYAIAEVEARFWKNILDDLSTCRKLIENATINISVELKAQNNANILDRMNQRGEQE